MGKNIIYIHPFLFPSTKANTVQVIKMCSAFKQIGNEPTLVSLKKFKSTKDDIMKFYGVRNNINTHFFLPLSIFSRNLSKYIIILVIILKYFLYRKKYIIFSRDIKIVKFFLKFDFKVLLELHSIPKNINDLEILKKISKKENFLKLIFISKELDKYFKKKINLKKTVVSPDGVEVIKHAKKKILFKNKEIFISYVGSFHEGKGVDFIIKLAKNLENLTFNIYGGLDEEIKELKKRVTKNVKFYGHLPNSKINNILLKTDIALMPYQKIVSSVGHKDISKWMSPLKMFEYMSHKTVILSSNHKVLREVLNINNSFIIKNFREIDWIKKIKFIIKNKKIAKKKAEQAHRDAFKYTWLKRAELIINGK